MSYCFCASERMAILLTVRSLDSWSYEIETHMIIYMYETYRHRLYTMFDLRVERKFEWKLESNGRDEDRTMAAVSR